KRRVVQDADEPTRVNYRSVAVPHAASEDGRAATLRDLFGREPGRLFRRAQFLRDTSPVLDRRVLRGCGGHLQEAVLVQPRILTTRLQERTHRRDDLVACRRQLERALAAEQLDRRPERGPVAVKEATVAAARPIAAE